MSTDTKTTFERPRYFPGQVITAGDLTQDQDYFRDKLRRHNRMLHGWGIVCGAKVEIANDANGKPKPWFLKVDPGYILGPCGDEIEIVQTKCCDLRIKCAATVTVAPNPCAEAVTQVPPAPGGPFVVVIRYRQNGARPVRVSVAGCGCGENPCENSRWLDDYELCVLDALPPTHLPPAPPPPKDCLAMPTGYWVALAAGTVASDGTVTLDATFKPDMLAR